MREPHAALAVDAGLATATTIDYPGVPRTEPAYRMLPRFGRAQAASKYSAHAHLDVDALVRALRVLQALRAHGGGGGGGGGAVLAVDLEATLSEAREMVRAGTLFGTQAVAAVDAAAAHLDHALLAA